MGSASSRGNTITVVRALAFRIHSSVFRWVLRRRDRTGFPVANCLLATTSSRMTRGTPNSARSWPPAWSRVRDFPQSNASDLKREEPRDRTQMVCCCDLAAVDDYSDWAVATYRKTAAAAVRFGETAPVSASNLGQVSRNDRARRERSSRWVSAPDFSTLVIWIVRFCLIILCALAILFLTKP